MAHHVRRTTAALVTSILLLSGCQDGSNRSDPPFSRDSAGPPADTTYPADLEAPDRNEFDGSDVYPSRDDGVRKVELDSGSRFVLWVDPDDIRRVLVQFSDPDDTSAWTEPQEIFTAGDGCLTTGLATDGTTVAVGLGCYEEDAFIQQAPDQGAALVSTDLVTWDVEEVRGEFSCDDPTVENGTVTFVNDVYDDEVVTWEPGEGFTASRS